MMIDAWTSAPTSASSPPPSASRRAAACWRRSAGKVYVCCDVSGSMSSPLTGHRAGATTKVRCIDVAALIAAAVLRKNDAEVLAFEHSVVPLELKRNDGVMRNAQRLAALGGGGTNCSAPLAELNARQARGALVIYVSDVFAKPRRCGASSMARSRMLAGTTSMECPSRQ